MGISISVQAYRAFDEKYGKMRAIYKHCCELEIDVPDEVLDYFGDDEPSRYGLPVDLYKHESIEQEDCCGCVINVKKLPENVEKIRVRVWY